jgi:GTP-binding protein LepA
MNPSNIRNFSIIAHIDHGKSTLADRFLDLTGTVEKRKMREQYLDQMDLEREKGITIKMQPVQMLYKNYQLNLIDTPGHIDFSYEVSRALKAVEGAILLVDATQGVQAQTFSNAEMAKSLDLAIIPVVNKIDSLYAKIDETKEEIVNLLGCKGEDILAVSAKTGEGVDKLLEEIIKRVPPPASLREALRAGGPPDNPQALIFDFSYSPHKGVIAYVRMMKGCIKKGEELFLSQVKERFTSHEVGFFHPELKEEEILSEGEIGYIITNIKKPAIVRVGDTIVSFKNPLPALSGYEEPKPVVFSSIYPESQNDFTLLKQALERLHLSDSSFHFEEEGPASAGLGRGFKCGFLGMLHLEIIAERLKREFNLKLITASPSVVYSVHYRGGKKEEIYSAARFPDDAQIKKIYEPWIEAQIISPAEKMGNILKILQKHEAEIGETEQFGSRRISLKIKMALREFMRNFFDEIKSASEGYASLSYKIAGMLEANLTRLDILVANEVVQAFSRVIKHSQVQAEAKELVEKLRGLLPRQLFVIKIQARANGRIIASQTLSALKKDVTGYLYGGDRTRKMKLWQKQKAGKKRLKERGKVNIPHEVFLKMLAP